MHRKRPSVEDTQIELVANRSRSRERHQQNQQHHPQQQSMTILSSVGKTVGNSSLCSMARKSELEMYVPLLAWDDNSRSTFERKFGACNATESDNEGEKLSPAAASVAFNHG
jgi:hypothetical protein